MDINDLAKKACSGDKEALISLVMEKKQEYYRLAYTYMLNQHDSLDAMQEMIVLLYKNIRSLKNHDAFYSWSKTILVNCCKSMIRQRRKIILLDYDNEEQYIENYQSRDQKNAKIVHFSSLKIA